MHFEGIFQGITERIPSKEFPEEMLFKTDISTLIMCPLFQLMPAFPGSCRYQGFRKGFASFPFKCDGAQLVQGGLNLNKKSLNLLNLV